MFGCDTGVTPTTCVPASTSGQGAARVGAGRSPSRRRARPTCGVNHWRRTIPFSPGSSSPRREVPPGPRGAANCWIPAAGPSLHPLEKFLARSSLSPPSRRSSGCARPAPTSCRALGRRARAGVPGGRACSWPPPRAARGLGSGRERRRPQPLPGATFKLAPAPGQPLAPSAPDPAGRRPCGEWPSLLPSPSASGSAQSPSETLPPPKPPSSRALAPAPRGVRTRGG